MNKATGTNRAVIAIGVLFLAGSAWSCPNVASIRVTAKENHLSLNDNAPVCVVRDATGNVNDTFQLTVALPNSFVDGDIRVEQKESAEPMTIEGVYSQETNKVEVHVSGPADVGDEFKYKIYVKDIGMLDPKVRVVGPQYWSATLAESLDDFLKANGVSAEEAFKALADFKADEKTDEPAQ
jgi:hypothetical protein